MILISICCMGFPTSALCIIIPTINQMIRITIVQYPVILYRNQVRSSTIPIIKIIASKIRMVIVELDSFRDGD